MSSRSEISLGNYDPTKRRQEIQGKLEKELSERKNLVKKISELKKKDSDAKSNGNGGNIIFGYIILTQIKLCSKFESFSCGMFCFQIC